MKKSKAKARADLIRRLAVRRPPLTYDEIASRTGTTKQNVSRICRAAGIRRRWGNAHATGPEKPPPPKPRRRKRIRKKDWETVVVDRYRGGASLASAASSAGVTTHVARSVLAAAGVRLRRRGWPEGRPRGFDRAAPPPLPPPPR